MSFCNIIYVLDHWFPTFEYYWTTIFRLSVSTFMSHIIFGMPTWYLSVFFLYLCVNVFIWCHCCFIHLKLWKKWIYFVFLNICRGLPIFSADVAEKMFSGPLPIFCRCRCFLLCFQEHLAVQVDLSRGIKEGVDFKRLIAEINDKQQKRSKPQVF